MPGPSAKPSAVVAEKPSVARDIASALGATKRGDGYLHGNGWIVTWAIGHLVALAEPHDIKAEWRKWRRSDLPILPQSWPLVAYDRTKDQFATVKKILNSEKIERIVCATDAGREGELIFRYICEAAGASKPVERLWISSLTREAIEEGFRKLRPGSDFDDLAAAARARSRADWLVGMNLSRLYSLAHDDNLSVGRVQTPTLGMIVDRELEIRNFNAEDYYEVLGKFRTTESAEYAGTWFQEVDGKREPRLPGDGKEAKRIAARAAKGTAKIESVERETRRSAPPLLYDLTELQRHGNRLYGFSAERTLELAQRLYERDKLITYPRTDSRCLTSDMASKLGGIVDAVATPYRALLVPETGRKALGKRYINDAKVSDHHAIIPTGKAADGLQSGSDEHKIFDLIVRRLLQAWQPDHVASTTTVVTAVRGDEATDLFLSSGVSVEREGWKALDVKRADGKKAKGKGAKDQDGETEADLPGGLEKEQDVAVLSAEAKKKRTRPPRRLTDAALLTAMESAGAELDDKELSEAMRERGLGTPATRASIIETLLKREYVVRRKKALEATDKGIRLIGVVHPKVKSPAMTGEWEAQLKGIERGADSFDEFMAGIERYVKEVVEAGPAAAPRPASAAAPTAVEAAAPKGADPGAAMLAESASRIQRHATLRDVHRAEESFGKQRNGSLFDEGGFGQDGLEQERPAVEYGTTAPDDLVELLRSRFGFESFRPHQHGVCRAVVEGKDTLLVMPTGAGKSLCYQLPGIARGGVTLVISPLIALMEDQVAKLKEQGFRAERIHSGRSRQDSRQACFDYLEGRLDFLFIAPERLAVPRFPEMLAKRKPALIAIDEAHCISQWGHDFRPEYRMLGQRLPLLRPAPVIGLTATATPRVQTDICDQLGLESPLRSIHGFRRENIAVEVVELTPSQRTPATLNLLRDPQRRPAIVYAPTRKAAEQQAAELSAEFPAAAYHAGMLGDARDQVQSKFLEGSYEVIIATIAFGMGIDKPNVRTVVHTGLPGSVEGYYQEIGRAGRDGLPSLAVLMHSWNDRRTHEFFTERDYPDVGEIEKVYNALTNEPCPRQDLENRVDLDPQIFEKALEKLWIHHGAVVDPEENIARGEPTWRRPYLAQREHRIAQLQAISRYTEASNCRMLELVGHFGDQEDSRKPCGICDVCAPDKTAVLTRRDPTAAEAKALDAVMAALRERDGQATGRLWREMFEGSDIDRKHFDRLIAGLARAGYVGVYEDSFEKAGETIEFRRVSLTHEGRQCRESVAPYVQLTAEAPKAPRKRKKKTPAKGKSKAGKRQAAPAGGSPDPLLAEALRAWRLSEAKRKNAPAFTIFSNRTLDAVAADRPQSEAELLAVHGIGPKLVKQYGEEILAVVRTVGQ